MTDRSSNVEDMTTPTYIDLTTAAKRIGIEYGTLRNYHHRAEKNRKLAEQENDPSYIRPGDLPKPDNRFSRSPVWFPQTIDLWLANRPGQGKGGGRPVGFSPKKKTEVGVGSNEGKQAQGRRAGKSRHRKIAEGSAVGPASAAS